MHIMACRVLGTKHYLAPPCRTFIGRLDTHFVKHNSQIFNRQLFMPFEPGKLYVLKQDEEDDVMLELTDTDYSRVCVTYRLHICSH